MNDYAKASAAVNGNAPADPHFLCCKTGCLNLGSVTGSTQGTKDWYCWDHFRRPKPKSEPLRTVDGTAWIDGQNEEHAA